MASIFTQIIDGKLPGRFVWSDEHCVGFLTVHPIRPGHTLVVPRAEVDHWLDLEPALATHLTLAAQSVGRAIQRAFQPVKVALMIAGLEVPHTHLHVFPVRELADINPAKQDLDAKPVDLDDAARKIRDALRALGHTQASDRP